MKKLSLGLVIGLVMALGSSAGAGAATAATFAADTAAGPIGTVVNVHSIAGCVAPSDAVAWIAIVKVAQGANPELTFNDMTVAADGSWSGQITIPTGAAPGPAQLTATCFDAAHTSQTTVDYTPHAFAITGGALDHLTLAPPTATITAGTSQAYTAEGFDAQGNDLGDVTAAVSFSVDNGGTCAAASCTATPGAHKVTGTDGAATGTASLTVTKAASAVTVSVTPSHPGFGTPVTFLATVLPTTPNPLSPAGTVSFFLDGQSTPVATVTLAGSSAAFTTSGLGAGTHTVAAIYSGDSNFVSSASTAASVTIITTTTVTGSHRGALIVSSGSSVLLLNAKVSGRIIVQPGGSLDVENSTIGGTATVIGASALRICGSTIRGDLVVTNARGFALVGDIGDDNCAPNRIGGSLVLLNNTHGLEVIGNHVGESVISAGNAGVGAFPEDTAPDISGNSRR